MDRVQMLAGREFDDVGPKGVAKLARVSEAAADALIAGSKPVTDKVLSSVARSAQTSGHWILLGEGSKSSEPSSPEDELQFIHAMRTVDETVALLMLFVLDLEAVLDALPHEEGLRVMAALRRVSDGQSCQALTAVLGEGFVKAIRGNLAEAMFRREIRVEDLINQTHMFTPIDALLGAFGPEQGRSLMDMLVE